MRSDSLNGTWIPVSEEIGGKVLPAAAFQDQKLVLDDSTYLFSAESVDKGVVRLHGNKMDIYGKDGVNAGKHFTAIFKFDNGILTICYNLAGDSYPESFATAGKPLYFLSTFKIPEAH
jgi:uncharacterized protein (TIGR03067 family)